MSDALPPAELFQHAEFLKRLARGLLCDEHLAEDAVQDAFVAALERPPRAASALPPWLATVARRLALNRRKSEERRVRRERASARSESVDGDVEVAQRLELQRCVSDFVLQLDEPKRMVVYLRYYEGLEPQAIAARLGVPVKTVKTRLSRALAELRERLDARTKGDRGAWVSAFLPLAGLRRSSLPSATEAGVVGGVLMRLSLTAAGLVLTAWVLWRPAPQSGAEPIASTERAKTGAPDELESAPRPAGREAVRAEENQAASRPTGSAALAGSEATLILRVLAKETGAPLAGIEISIDEHRAGWNAEGVSESRGGWDTTNTRGRLAWSPEVGVALELDISATDPALAGSAHLEVPALAPGERRDLVVQLATTRDLRWFGLIVDGTSQTPLADASVEVVTGDPFAQHTGEATALSGADGIVQLTCTSWRESYARIELEGYATSFVQLDGDHGQPASAFSVRLLRAATLEFAVADPSGAARAGLDVRVSAEPYELMQAGSEFSFNLLDVKTTAFEARTDAAGRCVLGDLPPGIALSVEVRQDTQLLRQERRTLRLEPGEHRALRWNVGGLCRLAGRALEADGRPAQGVTVWLVSDNGHRLLEVLYGGQPLAQARSDADGRFTLDVGAGSWLVGPAPAEINPRYEKKPTDIAPAGEHVLIAPEQTEAEVTLTCWRGLFLSGTVRGLEGELVDSGMVTVTGEGVYFSRSFGDGAFSMGPLPQGSYQVRASGTGADEHSDSEPVTAAAGTEGIELRLRKSSWLTVHVLDARGEPAAGAMVWIIGDERYGNRSYTGANGETRFDNLPRQTFALSAFGAAGEFALARNVTLDAGTEQREIELRLAPAARLRIEVLHGPERPLEAVIVLDGDEILVMDLADGAVTALAPGDYEVFLWGDAEEEVQRKSVHVAAEGETSVVFDLSAPR